MREKDLTLFSKSSSYLTWVLSRLSLSVLGSVGDDELYIYFAYDGDYSKIMEWYIAAIQLRLDSIERTKRKESSNWNQQLIS